LRGGLAIPAASLVFIVWLLASTSLSESRDVGIAALAGAVIYVGGRKMRGARTAPVVDPS
jgi:hypothetical protein